MKKLFIVLICALALGLIFENAFARGFNYCNFFMEYENLKDLSVHEGAINDEELMTPTEKRNDYYFKGMNYSIAFSYNF